MSRVTEKINDTNLFVVICLTPYKQPLVRTTPTLTLISKLWRDPAKTLYQLLESIYIVTRIPFVLFIHIRSCKDEVLFNGCHLQCLNKLLISILMSFVLMKYLVVSDLNSLIMSLFYAIICISFTNRKVEVRKQQTTTSIISKQK